MAPFPLSDKTGKNMIRVVQFETRYPANRDPVDWVLVAPMGESFTRTQTWHRVKKIKPPETQDDNILNSLSYKDMAAKWSIIGPAYEAWKEGNTIPDSGTPLEAWSGVSKEQVKILKALDVRTVEDVRDMGDATISKLRIPNARQLPKLAGDYLSGATEAEKDAKIAQMEEKMAAMEELLAESMKKKPGRPKKEPEAA